MNRRIKNQIKIIRQNLDILEDMMDETEEEPVLEAETITTTNWSTSDYGIYTPVIETPGVLDLKTIKGLASLKDVTITGEVRKTFDLKSYVKKDQTGTGMIYRFVLGDPSDEIVVVCFDKMAEEFKQYPIGTHLRITNAWQIKVNKHDVPELHVGNFAKIEVVE